jgi:hypothetical protein
MNMTPTLFSFCFGFDFFFFFLIGWLTQVGLTSQNADTKRT